MFVDKSEQTRCTFLWWNNKSEFNDTPNAIYLILGCNSQGLCHSGALWQKYLLDSSFCIYREANHYAGSTSYIKLPIFILYPFSYRSILPCCFLYYVRDINEFPSHAYLQMIRFYIRFQKVNNTVHPLCLQTTSVCFIFSFIICALHSLFIEHSVHSRFVLHKYDSVACASHDLQSLSGRVPKLHLALSDCTCSRTAFQPFLFTEKLKMFHNSKTHTKSTQ